jgi:pilus assembly protein Flp/PilA
MELTLASLVNEALSDAGPAATAEVAASNAAAAQGIAGQRRRQRTLTNEPAERVEARAGTPCEFPLRSGAARLKKMLKQFIADESGATAIEYGSIAADIAIAIVPALNGVGSSLKVKFTTISTSLK